MFRQIVGHITKIKPVKIKTGRKSLFTLCEGIIEYLRKRK